jgi:hypothetical protein
MVKDLRRRWKKKIDGRQRELWNLFALLQWMEVPSRATSNIAAKEKFLRFPGRVGSSFQDTSEIKVKARCSSSK